MTLSMTSIERKEEEGRRKESKKQNLRNAKMKLAHNTLTLTQLHTQAGSYAVHVVIVVIMYAFFISSHF